MKPVLEEMSKILPSKRSGVSGQRWGEMSRKLLQRSHSVSVWSAPTRAAICNYSAEHAQEVVLAGGSTQADMSAKGPGLRYL